MKIYISFLFALQLQICICQNSNKIWYFGDGAGLDFNSGTAVALKNGALLSYDGSAAASDNNGNLLFYTNGETVWNKNHKIMMNGQGLYGSTNCMHSATIVPVNGIPTHLFYIFTCDDVGGPNGLSYSLVDMDKQGGLGEVDLNFKNVPLVSNLTEKVVAIPHKNRLDYWVIAHALNSADFYIFLVTNQGIISTPTIQTIGSVQPEGSPYGDGGQGQITASSKGDRIAMASYTLGEYQLFNFDNNTGQLSNPITLASYIRAWGVEFSADGQKLYTSRWVANQIYQFDLSVYNQSTIKASATIIGKTTGPDPNYTAGTLQLGVDGKIYIAKWQSKELAIINNPDVLGAACNFNDHGINLGGKLSLAGLCYTIKLLPVPVDPCDVIVSKTCLVNGMVQLTALDINSLPIVSKTRQRELFWDIKDGPAGLGYSLIGQNPVTVSNHTKYTVTSKIFTWPIGKPHTIEFATICERRSSDSLLLNCPGPCEDFSFILSSCLDDYDVDNNLNFPPGICKSVCKNSCDYIVGVFGLNGELADPNYYSIHWSTGETGNISVQKGCINYNITLEIRRGDCVWRGRYRPSCTKYSGTGHIISSDPLFVEEQHLLIDKLISNNPKFSIFNLTGHYLGNSFNVLNSLSNGIYFIFIETEIGIVRQKLFISSSNSTRN